MNDDRASSQDDLAHADIGIVCALRMELAPFLNRCLAQRKYSGGDFVFRGGRYDQSRVAVVESGSGFDRARRATEALIDAHTPNSVISCGFVGALQPEMQIGDIVMANAIVDQHGQQVPIEINVPGDVQPGLYVDRLLTADALVRTVEEKAALGERHQAVAVDLESLAVAQVCAERQIRFMVVRVVSDDMSQDLPREIESVLAGSSTRRLGAALGSLWKRPSSYKELWELRQQAQLAADRLAEFLDGVVEQLYDADH